MRIATAEIKQKIKQEAIKRLQNGNSQAVVNKDVLDSYFKMLLKAWQNEEITFDWEIN